MSVSESRIIDADGHVVEPGNTWLEYNDPKFREKAPRLVENDQGGELFWFSDVFAAGDGSVKLGMAGAMGARDGDIKVADQIGVAYEDSHPGGFDPHARIPDMDKESLDVAFLYPTMGLFLDFVPDAAQARANSRGYNRWLADYCSAYPERLHGVASLPMRTVEGAIEEAKFCAKELGYRAVFVRPNPVDGRALHHPDFDPLWAVLQDLDLAVGVHGSDAAEDSLGYARFPADEVGAALHHMAAHTFEMMAAASSFVMGGVCDRFPRLRVAFLEAGGGWMPGLLDRMDRHHDDDGYAEMSGGRLSERPSDIFARQCFVGFEPTERSIEACAALLGPNQILFATDYPHPDGFWGAARMIKRMHLEPDLEAKVLGGAAKEFYGLA